MQLILLNGLKDNTHKLAISDINKKISQLVCLMSKGVDIPESPSLMITLSYYQTLLFLLTPPDSPLLGCKTWLAFGFKPPLKYDSLALWKKKALKSLSRTQFPSDTATVQAFKLFQLISNTEINNG